MLMTRNADKDGRVVTFGSLLDGANGLTIGEVSVAAAAADAAVMADATGTV